MGVPDLGFSFERRRDSLCFVSREDSWWEGGERERGSRQKKMKKNTRDRN